MTAPSKFAHVVYNTHRYDEMIDWYLKVFEARVQHRDERLAFLTYDEEHHRLALIADPRVQQSVPDVSAPGLDHFAYTYASFDDLLATYERLRAAGIVPYWTINHGPTTSLYYRNPDGINVELQIDNLSDPEALSAWMRSEAFLANPIGENIDFEDLAARYRAGASLDDLLVRRG